MNNDDPLNGVNGWLLLFIILKFLSPVSFLLSLFFADRFLHRMAHIASMRTGTPHTAPPAMHTIVISPAVHLALLIVTITTILIMLTGVLAAIGILLRSRWALQAVALNLVLSIFSALMPFVQPGHPRPAIFYRELLGLAITMLWFAYFYSSVRVRKTLGHNLFQTAPPQEP
jgi:hypothetical protein